MTAIDHHAERPSHRNARRVQDAMLLLALIAWAAAGLVTIAYLF